MLEDTETPFSMSSDGGEASVEDEVAEEVALSEGAEPPVLLSELFDAEVDASGVETLFAPFGRGTGTAIGCCCCCSDAPGRCASI